MKRALKRACLRLNLEFTWSDRAHNVAKDFVKDMADYCHVFSLEPNDLVLAYLLLLRLSSNSITEERLCAYYNANSWLKDCFCQETISEYLAKEVPEKIIAYSFPLTKLHSPYYSDFDFTVWTDDKVYVHRSISYYLPGEEGEDDVGFERAILASADRNPKLTGE